MQLFSYLVNYFAFFFFKNISSSRALHHLLLHLPFASFPPYFTAFSLRHFAVYLLPASLRYLLCFATGAEL